MKSPWAKPAAANPSVEPAAAPGPAAGGGDAATAVAVPAPEVPPGVAAAAAAIQGQGKIDYLKGCRSTWTNLTRCAAGTRPISIMITMLPSAYICAILIWVYGGVQYNVGIAAAYQIAHIMGGYVSSLAALVFLAGLLGATAIGLSWPGVLSVCARTIEVQAHFLIVLAWLLLTASWNAGFGSFYGSFILFVIIGLGPAIVLWSFTGAVMSRRREILSGIDGH